VRREFGVSAQDHRGWGNRKCGRCLESVHATLIAGKGEEVTYDLGMSQPGVSNSQTSEYNLDSTRGFIGA